MALKYTKMSGFATTHGQDFEVHLAALLFLRGLNSDLDFQLGTNVKGAGAMDDVVFRFKGVEEPDTCWTTLYVQLKHMANMKVGKKELRSTEGPFSLPKYFKSSCQIKESMSLAERETLFDGSFEKCLFVIFTNAKAKAALGQGRCENFSRAEEFLWTDSGNVFSFEEDEDMLNCLGESSDDGAKFLGRLRVFFDQPKAMKLRSEVRDELYNVSDEVIRGVDVRKLCDAFLGNAKDWWEHSTDILHRGHDLLLRSVGQVMLESSRQSTLTEFRLGVEFKDEAISSLIQTLASDVKVIVIESSESSFRLSLTKLLQANGGQTLVLDSRGLLANKLALLAQWRTGDFKSLVVCTKDWSSESADEFCETVKSMCKIHEASSLWNVVFLTANNRVGQIISENLTVAKCITDESFLFSQLRQESRESVLDTKIKFQGCEVMLRQILGIARETVGVNLDAYLDASSVVEVLASQGSLSVGPALAPGVDYYVDRSLERATVVKASVLQEDALRETVTVRVMQCETAADRGLAKLKIGEYFRDSDSNNKNSLFEKAILYLSSLNDSRSMDHKHEEIIQRLTQSPLVPERSEVFTGPRFRLGLFECNSIGLRFGQDDAVTALQVHTSKLTCKQVCFLFVSSKTSTQDVVKLSDFVHSKHLLSLEHGQLRWIQSRADIESIRTYIDQDQVTRFAPKTAMDVEDRLVLICAEPGMGKSTLMTRLASNTKEAHPHYFVILIALNDHAQLFAEGKHKDVLEFLCSAYKLESPLQKALLKYALEVSGNVVVIFDGFDEIAPKYVEHSCHLLSSLTMESEASNIWMTSRNSIKQTLENRMLKFTAKILEFCGNEQRAFLTKFWIRKSTLSSIEFGEIVNKVLKSISQAIRDDKKNFLGIPLQTAMVAEVYEHLVTGSSEKSSLPDKLDLLVLLELFVEKKCSIFVQARLKIPSHDTNYEEHFPSLRKEFIEMHSKAGLILILDHDDIKLLDMERIICESSEFFQDIQSGKYKTGFIDGILNGKPRFVHRVYAEFFVAKWISGNLEESRLLITSKMFTGDFAVVRNIFDRILCTGFPLHTAVLNEDLEGVRTLLERLDVDADTKDRGDRTALHLAASRGTSEDREENIRRGEILDLLIGKTSDFDQVDNALGVSPLRYADVTQSWNAIDKLLHRFKIKENFYLTSEDVTNHGMLDTVFDLDLDKLLCFCLDNGLAVEHCSEGKSRLILRACEKGSVKVVSLLIGRNANKNIIDVNDENKSPLQAASENGHVQIVQLLCQQRPPVDSHDPQIDGNVTKNPDLADFVNMEAKDGRTAIHFAAKNGHSDVITYLIRKGGEPRVSDNFNNTPLHFAAQNKHLCAVRVLLESLVDSDRAGYVDSCDKDGSSGLMYGADGGCVECVKLLVQAGGKLTKANNNLQTPLMAAAERGHQEVVSYLMDNFIAETEGMSKMGYVNMENKDGESAMLYASETGNLNMISFLISQGGKPRSSYVDNSSPLHRAAEFEHPGALEVLLSTIEEADRAAAVNSFDKNGDSVLMCGALGGCVKCVQLLIHTGGKLTQASADGRTPLMAAAEKGHQEVVCFLLHNFNEAREGMSEMNFVNLGDKDGRTAIHWAAMNGHSDIVRFLIGQGGDPRCRDHDNSTPLHRAAESKNPGVVKVLLEAVTEEDRAAAVNSGDKNGASALMCGALGGCVECVQLLVQAGGKLTQTDETGLTPLMAAAREDHQEVVSYLLLNFNVAREGMSVMGYINMRNKDGITAIHFAARKGHTYVINFSPSEGGEPQRSRDFDQTNPLNSAAQLEHPDAVRVLLEAVNGEDRVALVNSCDKDGVSVLMCGALQGCVECVERVVRAGAELTRANDNGWTALMAAAQEGHQGVVSYLLHSFNAAREGMSVMGYINMGNKDGITAIHSAARNGHADIIRLLINQGGDPRSRAVDNNTPLHWAAQFKQPGAVRALLETVDETHRASTSNSCANSALMSGALGGCVECVELLVQAGEKLNQVNENGFTPLMTAAQEGHQEVVRYLLHNYNAAREGMSKTDYFNMKNKDGRTAIHFAAQRGHSEVITVLIGQGGDPRSRAADNSTPLHLAGRNKHPGALIVLLEAVTAEDRAAAVNSFDKNGASVLMCGAWGGCMECVQLLVQAGGKLTRADETGFTPLMAAAREGHQEVVNYLLHNFNAERESKSRTDYVSMGNKDGRTAIHWAAMNGHSDIIQCLISKGGDPRCRDHDNITPLHWAAQFKHPEAVRVLLKAVTAEDRAAAVNSSSKDGDSVLLRGVAGGCVECVQLLVQAGGKLTQSSVDGCTPLMLAAEKDDREVVSYLLHNFNAAREGMSRTEYVLLANEHNTSAIHIAAQNGKPDINRFMIGQGGDPRSRAVDHTTSVQMADGYKHLCALKVLLEAVHEEALAAAVNSCDKDGDSVLMCGAWGGCVKCVQLLVQAGGKLTRANNNLRTPLMTAADRNHLPVVSYLLGAFDAEREGISRLAFINMTDKDGLSVFHFAQAMCRQNIEKFVSAISQDFDLD